MKRNVIIGTSVIAILIAAGLAYTSISNKPESPQLETKIETSETKTASGKYADYSASSFASTSGARVLFFHASWCPQCRQLDTSIKAGKVPDNVTIYKTDYDSNQALRKKYGVTIQTTVVSIDANGNLVKKYVAYDDPTLQSVIDNLL